MKYRPIESSLSAENIGCVRAHVKIGKRWIKLTIKGLINPLKIIASFANCTIC